MHKEITKIFYWSPFFGNIGTVKSVLQSAISIKKYSKKKTQVSILNCFAEWDPFAEIIEKNSISVINIQKTIHLNTNIYGYFRSRFLNLFCFFFLYFNLKKVIIKEKPDYLIIHLLTYIPLILFFFNKFNTKLFLKISGKPKLNFYRKFLWKISKNSIDKIFCPTLETQEHLIRTNIFPNEKLFFLPDPIINISEINKFKKKKIENLFNLKNFFISIGRLTKQKNHLFLIKAFAKSLPNENLLILGDGELKNVIKNDIIDHKMLNKIHLINYQKNIFNFLSKSKALIITSEWEDPGFVMIEAAAINIPIISSDCSSGPKEFLDNNNCGFLYKNKSLEDFDLAVKSFQTTNSNEIYKKILNAKRKSRFYTKFQHFKILNRFIV